MILRLGVPTTLDYEPFLFNNKSSFWFKMKTLFLSNIPGSANPTLMQFNKYRRSSTDVT